MPSSAAHSFDRRLDVEDALDLALQRGRIPLLGVGIGRDALRHQLVDDLRAHVGHGLADIVVAHHVDALLEDDLALIVHHVVVLEHVLARVEVARLDLLLRLLQRLVDPGMRDGLAFLQAQLLQHAVHAVRAEDAHQVVFEGQVELGTAGVALAARAATQLVVDAPALVALGADHVEAAGFQRLLLLLGHIGQHLGDLLVGRGDLGRDVGELGRDLGGVRRTASLDLLHDPAAQGFDAGAARGIVRRCRCPLGSAGTQPFLAVVVAQLVTDPAQQAIVGGRRFRVGAPAIGSAGELARDFSAQLRLPGGIGQLGAQFLALPVDVTLLRLAAGLGLLGGPCAQ